MRAKTGQKLLFYFVFLAFFSMAGAHGAPLLRSGFYEVQPANTVFGSLLHLRNQDSLSEAKPIRILKGLKGSFGYKGRITTRFAADGQAFYFWGDALSGRTGRVDLRKNSEAGIILIAEGLPQKLHLRFLGTRSPSEDSLGIRTRYLAHRGFSYFPPYNSESIYPANTLPSLIAALEQGFAGFEFDLRLTADGEFIVSHDEDLSVATDCKGDVKQKILKELKRCYVTGSTMIPELMAIRSPTMARMPAFDDVLRRFVSDSRLERMVIDIKADDDARLEAAFRKAITPYLNRPDYLGKFLVLAHSEVALLRMKALNPWSKYFLEGDTGMEPLEKGPDFFPEAYGLPRAGHAAISLNVGLGAYLPFFLGVSRAADLVRFATQYKYPVMGWTVNLSSELSLVRAFVPELDFLLTDAPMSRLAALQLYGYYYEQP